MANYFDRYDGVAVPDGQPQRDAGPKKPSATGNYFDKYDSAPDLSLRQPTQPKPVEPQREPGFLSSVKNDVAGGVLDVVETGARAARALPGGPDTYDVDPDSMLGRTIGWAQEIKTNNPELDHVDREGLSRWFHEGLRSVTSSVIAGAPSAAAGGLIGGPIGMLAGFALGAGSTFGLAEYDQFMEEAEQAGVAEDEAHQYGVMSGLAEGGFEAATDLLQGVTLGVGRLAATPAKTALRKGVGELFKNRMKATVGRLALSGTAEGVGEMATAATQTNLRRKMGMTEQTAFAAASDAFGPAFVAGIMFGGLIDAGNIRNRRKTAKQLMDPTADQKDRLQAVEQVATTLEREDKRAATMWREYAGQAVKNNEAISLEMDYIELTDRIANLRKTARVSEKAAENLEILEAQKRLMDSQFGPEIPGDETIPNARARVGADEGQLGEAYRPNGDGGAPVEDSEDTGAGAEARERTRQEIEQNNAVETGQVGDSILTDESVPNARARVGADTGLLGDPIPGDAATSPETDADVYLDVYKQTLDRQIANLEQTISVGKPTKKQKDRLAKLKEDRAALDNKQPVTEQPVTEQPVTEQPVTEQPVTEQPVTEQPVTEQPDRQEAIRRARAAVDRIDALDDEDAKQFAKVAKGAIVTAEGNNPRMGPGRFTTQNAEFYEEKAAEFEAKNSKDAPKPKETISIRDGLLSDDRHRRKQMKELDSREDSKAEVAKIEQAEQVAQKIADFVNAAGFETRKINSYNARKHPEIQAARRRLTHLYASVDDVISKGIAVKKGYKRGSQEKLDKALADLDAEMANVEAFLSEQSADTAAETQGYSKSDFKKADDFDVTGEYESADGIKMYRDTEQFGTPHWYVVGPDGTTHDAAFSLSTQQEAVEWVNENRDTILGQETPDFLKSERQGTEGNTVEMAETELRLAVGGNAVDRLRAAGKLEIVQSSQDIQGTPLVSIGGDVQGFYNDGKITLIADAITRGTTDYVFKHEGLHMLMREDKIFSQKRAQVLEQFSRLASKEGAVKEAFDAVPEDTPNGYEVEEAFAYFLENPNNTKDHSLAKRAMAAVREWLVRAGFSLKKFSADDLVMLMERRLDKAVRRQGPAKISGPNLFSVRRGTGNYKEYHPTPATVEKLQEAYGHSWRKGHAKAAVVMMNPGDFLRLAAPGGADLDSRVEEYGGQFDESKMDDRDSLPTLYFDSVSDTSVQVYGHEGRARMRLAAESSITKVPVMLYFRGRYVADQTVEPEREAGRVPAFALDEQNGIKRIPLVSYGEPVVLSRDKTVDQIMQSLTGYDPEDLSNMGSKRSLNIFNSEMLQNKSGKFVKTQTIQQILNQKGVKQIEKDIVNYVLGFDEFKGQKDISFDRFKAAVEFELMPIDPLVTGKWSDYGADSVGFDYDDSVSVVYNSPIEHGIGDHFDSLFAENQTGDKIDYEIVPVPQRDGLFVAIDRHRPVGLSAEEMQDYVGTAGSEAQVQRWVEEYENAEPTENRAGVFGHVRRWYKGDDVYLAEVQSDFYQKHSAEEYAAENVFRRIERGNAEATDVQKETLRQYRDAVKVIEDTGTNVKVTYRNISENDFPRINRLKKGVQRLEKNRGDYIIAIANGDYFLAVKGTPVDLIGLDGYDFFLHESVNGGEYILSEKSTGRALLTEIEGNTEQERVENAKQRALEQDANNLRRAIERGTKLGFDTIPDGRDYIEFKKQEVANAIETVDAIIDSTGREEYTNYFNAMRAKDKALTKAQKWMNPQERQFIAHRKNYSERMIREEIQAAARTGKERLLLPTAHTLATIEGYIEGGGAGMYEVLNASDHDTLSEGDTIDYGGEEYTVMESDGYEIRVARSSHVTEFDLDTLIEEEIQHEITTVFEELPEYVGIEGVDDSSGYGWISGQQVNEIVRNYFEENGLPDDTDLNVRNIADEIESVIRNDMERLDWEDRIQEMFYDHTVVVIGTGYGERVYYTDDYLETFPQPSEIQSVDPDEFDIDDLNDDHQGIVRKYEAMADFLKKLRGEENVSLETDENGYRWYATDLTAQDASSPVILFSKRTQTGPRSQNVFKPEFKKWFGDSRIVNENGYPKVVYHGTNADFSTFKTSDRGIFFSDSPVVASNYTEYKRSDESVNDGTVMPVYLSMQDPVVLEFGMGKSIADAVSEAKEQGKDGVIIQNYPDTYAGFDTVADMYVVFKPTQIKSATGNSGAYSATNPDVRFSRRQSNPHLSPDLADKFGKKNSDMTVRERFDEVSAGWTEKLRQGIVDQFSSLRNVSETAWMKARMSKASSEATAAAFLHGRVYMDRDGAINVDSNGDGLVKTLAPLGDEVDRFFHWIAGNRARQLKQQGKENLFTDDDIAELTSLNEGRMPNGQDREAVYRETFEAFNEFKSSILDIARQSGLLDAEATRDWDQDFYVPFYRVMEDSADVKGPKTGSGLIRQQAFKKLKGGTENLNDLLHNTLMNWEHLLSASLKNNAARDALTAGADMGIARPITAREAKYNKESVFIKENGKDVHYEVTDPLVLQAISAINYVGANNAAMRVARNMKRLFTMGVTASPEFRVANLLRDTIQSIAVSPISKNFAGNLKSGFAATKKDGLLAAQMMAGGATMDFGYQLGADADAARKFIRRLQNKGGILVDGRATDAFRTAVGKMWRWWEDTGNRAENVNRAALYKQLRDQGKSHFEASFAAADVLDFRQGGAWPAVRFMTQVVPFLNARLQGLDKLGRSAMSENQRKQFAATVGAYSLGAVALYLMFKDDDDFKAREDWEKDAYLWFKLPGSDTAFRIPAPFEVGAIGAMAVRTVEQFADASANPELFFERLNHAIWQTFSFSPVPQIAQPILDVYANQDPFTDRPIEGMGMQRLPATERRRSNTSVAAELASKGMNVVAGEDLTLSPVQIDYLVEGYLGWVGSTVVEASEYVMRPLTAQPSLPAKRIDQLPLMSRFVRQNPALYTKYATDFYENLTEVNRMSAHIKSLRERGEIEKALELARENKDKVMHRKTYNRVQRQISNINKKIKSIYEDRSLSRTQKRDEVQRYQMMKNDLTKKTVEKMPIR